MRPRQRSGRSITGPSLRLQPLRSTAPQRVAMLGPEESEMTEFWHRELRGPDGKDFWPRAAIARAKQFDCRPSGPGVVGEMERANGALVFWKVGEAGKRVVIEQIARAHHPF